MKNLWIDYGFSYSNLISTARFHNIIIDVILRKSKKNSRKAFTGDRTEHSIFQRWIFRQRKRETNVLFEDK
jgi:hypothetical protein